MVDPGGGAAMVTLPQAEQTDGVDCGDAESDEERSDGDSDVIGVDNRNLTRATT